MTSTITYKGNLQTSMRHLAAGCEIMTDAPVDNHGKGEAFSPTDLVATALGSCMLTIMGIKVRDMGKDMTGSTVEITKHMASDPRRIAAIEVHIRMAGDWTPKEQDLLERAARTCPVALSLHPDLSQQVRFEWPGEH